jgi:hypothetical protein
MSCAYLAACRDNEHLAGIVVPQLVSLDEVSGVDGGPVHMINIKHTLLVLIVTVAWKRFSTGLSPQARTRPSRIMPSEHTIRHKQCVGCTAQQMWCCW